jgi:hypothetical protein
MKSKKSTTTQKTTAASEKAAREARTKTSGKRDQQIEAAIKELSGRYAYVGLVKPAQVPVGSRRLKLVSSDGKKLPAALYVVTKPEPVAAQRASKKTAKRTGAEKPRRPKSGKFYCGGLDSQRVQELLNKAQKHSSERPLTMTSFGDSQYPKRVLRMLASEGLITMERRDEVGVVVYAAR